MHVFSEKALLEVMGIILKLLAGNLSREKKDIDSDVQGLCLKVQCAKMLMFRRQVKTTKCLKYSHCLQTNDDHVL